MSTLLFVYVNSMMLKMTNSTHSLLSTSKERTLLFANSKILKESSLSTYLEDLIENL